MRGLSVACFFSRGLRLTALLTPSEVQLLREALLLSETTSFKSLLLSTFIFLFILRPCKAVCTIGD